MKKPKYVLWLCLLLLAVPLYFIACKKNTDQKPPQETPAIDIAQLKAAFGQLHFSAMEPIKVNETLSLGKAPAWEQVSFAKVNDDQSYVYVPISFAPIFSGEGTVHLSKPALRQYVVARINGDVTSFWIATYIADDAAVTDLRSFSGKLLLENNKGEITFALYRNGVPVKDNTSGAKTSGIICIDQYACTWTRTCMTTRGIVTDVTVTNGTAFGCSAPSNVFEPGAPNQECSSAPWTGGSPYKVGSTCMQIPDEPPPPPTPPGTGGPGNPPPPPPPPVLPGTGTPPKVTDVMDNLQNPCFKKVLAALRNGTLQNKVSEILFKTFGSSGDLNIRFDEAVLANTTDGQTLPVKVNNVVNMDVTINSLLYTNLHASQEYVAATMFHEILHAYFGANNYNPLIGVGHNDMGMLYVQIMADALVEVYPNLPKGDAIALAWGGVQESYAWLNIASASPATANAIGVTNQDYRKGTKGSVCP